MGSWVAVEPNGTRLPHSFSLGRLGAMLPSSPRASNKHRKTTLTYKHFLKHQEENSPRPVLKRSEGSVRVCVFVWPQVLELGKCGGLEIQCE
ncbi:MAG: hypothetical protein QXQ86_05260 [Sulfolobales archaeon]